MEFGGFQRVTCPVQPPQTSLPQDEPHTASDEENVIFRDPIRFGQALKLSNYGPKWKPVEVRRNPEKLREVVM